VSIPVILVGKSFWNEMVNLKGMVKFGVIDGDDMQIIHYAETAQEVWNLIQDWYQLA
jgi:predicted Rossmann-fold nucleotide-binding protein